MLASLGRGQCEDTVCQHLVKQVLVELIHCQESYRGLKEPQGGAVDLSLGSLVSQVECYYLRNFTQEVLE